MRIDEGFPRGYCFLVDQLNRAAFSIATNLAVGNGRFTKLGRKNFFTIARGSAQECVPLIEIARMLSGLINGLEKRKAERVGDFLCGRLFSGEFGQDTL